MCHEFRTRRGTRRVERPDEELRRLVDEERPRPEQPTPVVEREADEEMKDPERVRVEAGAPS